MKEIADCPAIIQFLESRGLDPAHAHRCGVRAFDELQIAYPLWNGQWKLRNVMTKDMMVAKMGRTEKPLPAVFGQLVQNADMGQRTFHVHGCEGETDALALSQVLADNLLPGIAVAIPGVNNMAHAVQLLGPMLGDNVHVTLYPDPDEAGNSLAGAASELGAHVVQLPPGKDLCEYLGSLESHHRWPALQLLRHHAAEYVPYKPPERPSPGTERHKGTDVPPGVLAYFQRMVIETVSDEHVGYAETEKVCCPWHEDPNPSLSIDWNRCIWFCHGCGQGGGVKKWQQLRSERAMTT